MQLLNRAVMVVKPKQPLLDWVNGLDDSDLALDDVRQDCPAYLIPEPMNDDDQDVILEAFLPDIVENELAGWYRDETAWPQINDLDTFKQWFEVSFHSMALDLDVGPLEREAFDPFVGPEVPAFFAREYSDEERAEILEQVGQWAVGFSQSNACQELPQDCQEAAHDIVTTFAELMYAYFLVWPEEWEVEELTECCLSIMPEKIMADEAYFRAIAPVLAAFLTYLASEEILNDGEALAEAVEEIGEGMVERGADPAGWGLTKSFVMQALDAGVDVTDEDELQQFIDQYNREQGQALPDNNGGTRHNREQLGRNDPCACGSGKKYKHCCGP